LNEDLTTELRNRILSSTSSWIKDNADYKKESELLTLDSSKVRNTTGWHDKYDFEESVKQTASWYRRITNGESSLLVSQEQVTSFELKN
jgi:dTDP-D-glucose 4,6-dehydratase